MRLAPTGSYYLTTWCKELFPKDLEVWPWWGWSPAPNYDGHGLKPSGTMGSSKHFLLYITSVMVSLHNNSGCVRMCVLCLQTEAREQLARVVSSFHMWVSGMELVSSGWSGGTFMPTEPSSCQPQSSYFCSAHSWDKSMVLYITIIHPLLFINVSFLKS